MKPSCELNKFISEITSSCKYYTNIDFNKKITDQMPSKNVPFECLLCKATSGREHSCTIWKYNAMNHLLMEHIEVKNNQSSVLLIPPWMKMQCIYRELRRRSWESSCAGLWKLTKDSSCQEVMMLSCQKLRSRRPRRNEGDLTHL